MPNLNNRCAGRSLVELLAAITIAAILTGAAVPSYSSFVMDTRMSTAAGDVHKLLFLARSEAVKRGQIVQMEALSGSTEWAQGVRMFVDADGNGTQDADETTLALSDPLESAYTLTGSSNAVRYLPSGVLSVAPAIVNFTVCRAGTNGEPGRTITVSQTGRPSVSKTICD